MARRTLKDDPFPTEGSKGFAPWVARRLEGRSDLERFQLAARATLRSFPFLRTLPNILPAAPLREPRDHLLSVIRCFPILAGVSFARFTDINRFRRHGADARISIDDEIVNTSGIVLTASRVIDAVAHLPLIVLDPSVGISVYPGDFPLVAVTWPYDAAISNKLAPYLGAAFEQDCRLLDSIGLTALACHRLWPDWDEEVAEAFLPLMPADHGFDPSPKAFREELARFIPRLRDLPGDFLVWVEWYDGIVRGSRNGRYLFGLPTGDMFDPAVGPAEGTALRLNLDIAMIDNALWKGDPAELHAEIRRLVEMARGEEAKEEENVAIDLAALASPQPMLNAALQIDAQPNPTFNRRIDDDELRKLPERQREIARAIRAALPRQAPATIVSVLASYVRQVRKPVPDIGLLDDMVAILAGDFDGKGADEWLSDGLKVARERFDANHAKIRSHYPLADARTEPLMRLDIDERNIDREEIQKAADAFVEQAEILNERGRATDDFLAASKEHQANIAAALSQPPDFSVDPKDRRTQRAASRQAKVSVLANSGGFSESTFNVIAGSASLAQLPVFQSLMMAAENLWLTIKNYLIIKGYLSP